jgi:hypothetical protein
MREQIPIRPGVALNQLPTGAREEIKSDAKYSPADSRCLLGVSVVNAVPRLW